MHHIIYMSRGVRPMNEEELLTLLEQARRENERQGITGALVYGDGQFMQIIEGEESVLAALYAKLLQDSWHINVVKLADKQIGQRSFQDWSMGFQVVSADKFAELAGYVDPAAMKMDVPGLSAADALLLQMMKTFVLTPPKE
ncbi:BLUF domain-containing protein [Hymenobacter sp. BT186]|uniref:BLUF domain-containing protein n=1 Tax=Hymenobacter telluris TaxID=2816474 RepID=A0A939EVM9_9BACT|nr:BLUF domain-containing protein [Hymenobacter telluris]MBO0357861.1 BLUF domain-containing protein [Hymenobacter telluris]MBW3373888.1 BLUF domain-containing protein [Hymenobacter norwichensis]